MRRSVWMLLMLTLTPAPTILAEHNKTITYRGVLADASGRPVPDGRLSVTFRLYEDAQGGPVLWQETQAIEVVGGRFEVVLGSISPLDLAVEGPHRLGITGGNGLESDCRLTLSLPKIPLGGDFTSGLTPGVLPLSAGDQGFKESVSLPSAFRVNNWVPAQGPNDNTAIFVHTDTLNAIEGRSEQSNGVSGIGFGPNSGVRGVSGRGSGVSGVGSGAGPGGEFSSLGGGPGIRASGNQLAADFTKGEVRINDVNLEPNQSKFLVWGSGNIDRYRTLPDLAFNGVLENKSLMVRDGAGNVTFQVDPDGTSFH
ncbi:MAG: hypothetical protein HY650_00840, partial [Acidobacteria bacterium]|nr:hypothetical protein [Acidobacteriota bacterium]